VSTQPAPKEYSIETTPFFSTQRTDMTVLAEAAVLIDQNKSVRSAANFFMSETNIAFRAQKGTSLKNSMISMDSQCSVIRGDIYRCSASIIP
jgi:hypothetical protein